MFPLQPVIKSYNKCRDIEKTLDLIHVIDMVKWLPNINVA